MSVGRVDITLLRLGKSILILYVHEIFVVFRTGVSKLNYASMYIFATKGIDYNYFIM